MRHFLVSPGGKGQMSAIGAEPQRARGDFIEERAGFRGKLGDISPASRHKRFLQPIGRLGCRFDRRHRGGRRWRSAEYTDILPIGVLHYRGQPGPVETEQG